MISAQNPQAGPQTDRGFQLVWGGWDFCFLLKVEFTGVGPKADEGLASESELVTFHPGDSTVIRWTSSGTWSDIREGLLRNFIALGRQNSAFQDWESLALRELGLRGCVWPAWMSSSAGKWELVFEFPQGMRKWILFLQISVISIGTDFWKTLWKVQVKVLVAQSCPTLCDPADCSPPGSSVHEIL